MTDTTGHSYRSLSEQSSKLKKENIAISREGYRLLTGLNIDALERPWKAYHDAKRELTLLNDSFILMTKSNEQVQRIWESANEKTDVFSAALRLYLHAVQQAGDPDTVVTEYTWGVKAVSNISTLLATSVMLQNTRLGNKITESQKREVIEAIFGEAENQWPKEHCYLGPTTYPVFAGIVRRERISTHPTVVGSRGVDITS